jgi:hypothetical protein
MSYSSKPVNQTLSTKESVTNVSEGCRTDMRVDHDKFMDSYFGRSLTKLRQTPTSVHDTELRACKRSAETSNEERQYGQGGNI